MKMQRSLEQIARTQGISETFELFERFIPIRGKRIFEIGADKFFVSAIEMMVRGAEAVECTNLIDARLEEIANVPGIQFSKMDSAHTTFENGSFDVVFGRAVLEHINNIDQMAAEVHRILKPGGMFYLDGGPMWTCRHGHHVWVEPAPSGAKYTFPMHSTFEPWEHLQYNKDQMKDRLLSRGISPEDTNAIISHVYLSNEQSRIAPSTIIEIFAAMPDFDFFPIRLAVGTEPPAIEPYSQLDLRTGALYLIGRKLASGDNRGDFRDFVYAGLKLFNRPFLY